MLASAKLPEAYADWNRRWKAPFGRRTRGQSRSRTIARWAGPFAHQSNSTTRRFEYPWAYYAVPLSPGMRVVEVGGALSGFQFVLASQGLETHNVDPFLDYGSSATYDAPEERHAFLNRTFGTDVRLHRAELPQAALASESVDVVYCISALEHFPAPAVRQTLSEVHRVLRPGGRFVLTLDLFLDCAPFSSQTSNRWGRNVSVAEIVEESRLELVQGDTGLLHGFDDFEVDRVMRRLPDFLVGDYPVLTQLVVLGR